MPSGVLDWVRAFRALHHKAKERALPPEEQRTYLQLREQLARSILTVQGLSQPRGESARRSFRVAILLRIALKSAIRSLHAVTVDLSVGGFSAILDQAPDLHEVLDFSLDLSGAEALTGQVKVVGTREHATTSRVSFAFDGLSQGAQERLEIFVFDTALTRLPE